MIDEIIQKEEVIVTLTSGTTIRQGSLKLRFLDKLFTSKGSEFVSKLLELLSLSTMDVLESDLYLANGALIDGILNWKKTYEGDWMKALVSLRIKTHGNMHIFKAQCPGCKDRAEQEVDLSLLKETELTDEVREILMKGTNIIYKESSIGKLGIRIPTGQDNILFQKSQRMKGAKQSKEPLKNSIEFKIVSVEGVKNLTKWREDLDAELAAEIFGLIEDVSFGIDSEAEIECPYCGHVWEFDIPFNKDFFLPRKTKRK